MCDWEYIQFNQTPPEFFMSNLAVIKEDDKWYAFLTEVDNLFSRYKFRAKFVSVFLKRTFHNHWIQNALYSNNY